MECEESDDLLFPGGDTLLSKVHAIGCPPLLDHELRVCIDQGLKPKNITFRLRLRLSFCVDTCFVSVFYVFIFTVSVTG